MTVLPKVLTQPQLPNNLPETSKWLSGEGAGSWFVLIENGENILEITRYSPTGNFECYDTFTSAVELDLTNNYVLDYPSHCAVVTIIMGDKKIKLQAK